MEILKKELKNNLQSNIGSISNQIITLTQKINNLQLHFDKHAKDFHNKSVLLKIISRRKKLLRYIKVNNYDTYTILVNDLNIRK